MGFLNVLAILVSFGLGMCFCYFWITSNLKNCVGTIYFFDNEPGEEPFMTAELNVSPEEINEREYATFKISHK